MAVLAMAYVYTATQTGTETEVLERIGANWGPAIRDGEWWRLGVSTLLHGGVLHLMLNVWALVVLGRVVERDLGTLRWSVLYVATGVLASMTSVAWRPAGLSVGASGAIFGLLGAMLALFVRRRKHMTPAAFRAGIMSLLLVVLVNVAFGLAVPVVDNAAHIGGLIAGFVLTVLLTTRLAWLGLVASVLLPLACWPLLMWRLDGATREFEALDRMTRVQAALEAQDAEMALALLDEGVAADPKDLGLRWLRAQLRTALGRFGDASIDYTELWEAQHANTHLEHRAFLYSALDRRADASSDFQLLAQQSGGEFEGRLWAAIEQAQDASELRALCASAVDDLGTRRVHGADVIWSVLLRYGAGQVSETEVRTVVAQASDPALARMQASATLGEMAWLAGNRSRAATLYAEAAASAEVLTEPMPLDPLVRARLERDLRNQR